MSGVAEKSLCHEDGSLLHDSILHYCEEQKLEGHSLKYIATSSRDIVGSLERMKLHGK
jgi:hypothetical protein